MRLVTRLVLSHAALAAILVAALAVMIASLGEIGRQVRDVRERDLATIDEEEDLHRAAWAIEVAARHAIAACENGKPEKDVEASLAAPTKVLRETIAAKGEAANPALRATLERYLKLGEDLIKGDTCEKLRMPGSRNARLRLDEDLTNVWIARLYELHRSLEQKEEAIGRTGSRALTEGIFLGATAIGAALLVAGAIARGVTQPLARLAGAARRVGRGDFTPIRTAGGPREVRELSEELERMRSALAELDALKQQFLASVSHEMRTPLGKMREALALLADGTAGTLTERQRSVVQIARRACEAEIRLVTTLLDLSRLRAGKLLHRQSGQSLDDALHEAVTQERVEATARGVQLELAASGSVPTARLDGPMIERALANVIRNAVSVSSDGDVVEVRRELAEAGPRGARGPWVKVSVRDHGPGIPAEIRDAIFEAFTTREVPGRQARVGIGLGLAFAREVIRSHGGDLILVDPSPGNTTFEVWIPLGHEVVENL